jgi:hypothetical protein
VLRWGRDELTEDCYEDAVMTTASGAEGDDTRPPRRRRRLVGDELAAAALRGDVCVGLCVLGWLLPFGGGAVVVAVTSLAALAARHRLRVMVAAAAAGAVVGLLVAGPGLAGNVVICAVIGVVVGRCHRRGFGPVRIVVAAVAVVWPPVAALGVGLLVVFSEARTVALAQLSNSGGARPMCSSAPARTAWPPPVTMLCHGQ